MLTFSSAKYQPKILKAELKPGKNWLAEFPAQKMLAEVLWQFPPSSLPRSPRGRPYRTGPITLADIRRYLRADIDVRHFNNCD